MPLGQILTLPDPKVAELLVALLAQLVRALLGQFIELLQERFT